MYDRGQPVMFRKCFQTESFKCSLSALYVRRAVAVEFACRGMVNPHTDTSEQWLLWHGHAGPSFRANREVCDEAPFLRQ